MEVSTSLSNDTTKFSPSSSSSSSTSTSLSSCASILNKFSTATASFLLLMLFICTLVLTNWSDIYTLAGNSVPFKFTMFSNTNTNTNYPKKDEYILNCTESNMTLTCPSNYPSLTATSNDTCPEYFRWIHEDLNTWKDRGITQEMVEKLTDAAHFRLVIVNGTAYVKQYHRAFQTRDVYTLWGILQLLKLYPGRLPDIDLMFQCHDQASIKRGDYNKEGGVGSAPPQFHYCADESTLDIVFPDWSFWGWPEINIKPWVPLVKDLEDGNTMKNWSSREHFAFWKGNLHTGARMRLSQCNSIEDWGAQIIQQNWNKESREGFRNSDLSKQCGHRYKIYMEGNAWSVSEKYILACDAMTLLVNPTYYDFFTRSLIPMKHYWPVNPNNLCDSIKFAVQWGNNNTDKAQEIGREGSEYVYNQIKIEHVYDYMFHVLNEYGKLLRYKPTVPEGAEELCSERFACSPPGLETRYKVDTIVNGPSEQGPCVLPSPYDRDTLKAFQVQNSKIKEVVEMWERGK